MMRKSDEEYSRMYREKCELQIKVDKLEDFVSKARKGEVPDTTLQEIHTLEEQLHYMRGYLRILKQRLAIVS